MQADEARHGAGHGGAGGIGVVGRLEHHDLVAGLAQRQHGGGDGLGGAHGDEHLVSGSSSRPYQAALVGGDGLAQLGDAVAGRVLVAPRPDGVDRDLRSSVGPVGVGEALARG